MKSGTSLRTRGFTLIDLVIVLAVALLFFYIGYVTYANIVANREKAKASQESCIPDTVLNTQRIDHPVTVS